MFKSWISCAGRLRKTASVRREALAVRGSGTEGEVNSLLQVPKGICEHDFKLEHVVDQAG